MKPIIVPAILPKSYTDLQEKVESVSPPARRIQIDIVDGVFAKPATWPQSGMDNTSWQELITEKKGLPLWEEVEYEIDLMVSNPLIAGLEWIQAGASMLIFHFGSAPNEELIKCIEATKEKGVSAGLAVKPKHLFEEYESLLLNIELLQLMGNDEVGKQGLGLDEKVSNILDMLKEKTTVPLGVDIGVNEKTIPMLLEKGVVHFAVGSALLRNESPQKEFEQLSTLIH